MAIEKYSLSFLVLGAKESGKSSLILRMTDDFYTNRRQLNDLGKEILYKKMTLSEYHNESKKEI